MFQQWAKIASGDGVKAAVLSSVRKKKLAVRGLLDRAAANFSEAATYFPPFDKQIYGSYLIGLIEKDVRLFVLYDHLVELLKQALFEPWETDRYPLEGEALYKYLVNRFGQLRLPALMERTMQAFWLDRDKTKPSFPLIPSTWQSWLKKHEQKRRKRAHKPSLKIAHVISQVVDGAHAPTRIVDNLLQGSEAVFVTERFVLRPQEFPPLLALSESSWLRGKETLREWGAKGISVHVADTHLGLIETAKRFARLLDKEQIDAVVFHGVEVIGQVCAVCTSAPLRVFFDHGSLPEIYTGFDFAVLSRPETLPIPNLFLPFGYRAECFWEEKAYPKAVFGLKESDLLLLTASNSLEARLSASMCEAIAAILRKFPHAYYMPIGPLDHPEVLEARFKELGVAKQVKFLGSKVPAAQWIRSADLYLNEFPFGSGVAILEAMAAHVPVVTLYDRLGPAQSRYGAQYIGEERAVATPEEYAALACRLLQNKELRRKWGDDLHVRYLKHADVTAYRNAFHKMIRQRLQIT